MEYNGDTRAIVRDSSRLHYLWVNVSSATSVDSSSVSKRIAKKTTACLAWCKKVLRVATTTMAN